MADEKNQNDQVQDLLARLRSQMNQLDQMFGIDPAASDAPAPAAVSQDVTLEQTEDVPPLEMTEAEKETNTSPSEDEPKEEDTPEAIVSPSAEEKPETSASPILEQIDLFAALDESDVQETEEDPFKENIESDAEETPEEEPTLFATEDDTDDDTLVFSKGDAPIHIRKESIVAEELLLDREEEEIAVVVTEGERPTEDGPREQAESHASFFVPNIAPVEEESPATSLSPFSPERRFDPSKYDAMLAAYEKRKAEAFEDREVTEETPTLPPTPPKTPILMPTAVVVSTSPALEETSTSSLEEEVSVEESETVEDTPVETAVLENADDPTEEDVSTEELDLVDDDTSSDDETALDETAPIEDDTFDESLASAGASAPTEETAPTEELPINETAIAEEEPTDAEEPDAEEPAPEETAPIDGPAPEAPAASPRVVLARADLSDTERAPRSHAPSGRVHLAPTAYRAKDDRAQEKNKSSYDDDEEDFMSGLPSGIRESLVGFPLGRPNRAQSARTAGESAQKSKRKRKSYRFPEEIEGKRDEDAAQDYVRHHLKVALHQMRVRLIVIAVLSFVLLLLENITHVADLVPHGFVDMQTAGVIDALLLAGIAVAAWPQLYVGMRGLLHGRILPESILFVQTLLAFVYAAVFGALETPTMYLSFVPALGLSILYCFRVLRCETDLKVLDRVSAAGEKLILSPTAKKDMLAEMNALGKSLDGEAPLLYRIRKTATVKGFSERSSTVCEDEHLNLGILLSALLVGVACFLISFLAVGEPPVTALRAALFGVFLSAPIVTVAVHIYSMHRTNCVAGEDSAIVGEATVKEATRVAAISFEDIEAAPSAGVVLSGIQVHCDDPSTVFRYLTALYGHIGGPLCGRFSGMYTDKSVTATALVELVDATKDGISAAIDGAEIVVGNGRYMVAANITPAYDAKDESVLPDGRSGVLYVAVNGMICMKFYMEHRISAAFEKNVMRLHRLGIAAILRTYDPNFNDKTLARSSLGDCRVHVVSKTVAERNDFYAERAEGGLVTAGSSGKLLRLLLLCFRTRSQLRFGWVYKLVGTVLGAALSVVLCALGIFSFVPSVYLALYHLVLLALFMVLSAIGIKLPEISEGK